MILIARVIDVCGHPRNAGIGTKVVKPITQALVFFPPPARAYEKKKKRGSGYPRLRQ
jgi:hypothetical protein